jgi:hypothetical protein
VADVSRLRPLKASQSERLPINQRLKDRNSFQLVASLRLSAVYGPGRKFDHGMRRYTNRNPPRREIPNRFAHALLFVDIDYVEWKAHEEHVDGLAGNNPKA